MIPLMKTSDSESKARFDKIMNRSQLDCEAELASVKAIIKAVREQGDAAVFQFTKRFDRADIHADTIRVTDAEIDEAYSKVDDKLLEVIRRAKANIQAFHELQKPKDIQLKIEDGMVGQRVLPIERAGVYVPGGRAAYPSSVLMNVIPAKVAGVKEIIMVTPPFEDGSIYYMTLVAAKEAGVDKIYKVGGAQAVAALAFGTESIPKVDKIVGPGNIYVALAKREVFGYVGIDMVAGPSEVLIIADESANPEYCAADLLSQAEHDPMAAAIFLTDCEDLAQKVQSEVMRQMEELPTKETCKESTEACGGIIVVADMDEAVKLANQIAPEHLELAVKEPESLLPKIKNAGAIFMGEYSPEPLGDYYAGPNHVLPTSGTARYASPLGVYDFVKRSSIINYQKKALERVYKDVVDFATSEGLYAHAASARRRFEEES